jgi:hypothetical protein
MVRQASYAPIVSLISPSPFLRQSCLLGLQRGVVHTLSCLIPSESRARVRSSTISGPAGTIPVDRIVPADRA